MDWSNIINGHREVIDLIENQLADEVDRISRVMEECLRNKGKVLIAGNGGSAADAQHFAGELINRFLLESEPYAAIALTTDSSVITSISNDYEYNRIFEMQVRALGAPGDIFIGITTSGNSPNIIQAVDAAAEKGMVTMGFLGGAGGQLLEKVDYALNISCTSHTPRIQEGHLLMIHAICEQVEENLHKGN